MGKEKTDYRSATLDWFGRQVPPKLTKRYSIQRVKKRFLDIYGITIENNCRYKDRSYYARFNGYDADGNLVLENVTLNSLAEYLVSQGEYN